jgi:hypothetical protein
LSIFRSYVICNDKNQKIWQCVKYQIFQLFFQFLSVYLCKSQFFIPLTVFLTRGNMVEKDNLC